MKTGKHRKRASQFKEVIEMLKIKSASKYHIEVQHLSGELVRENAKAFQDKVIDLARQNNWHVILDLWDLEFMDSRGIAALLEVHKKIQDQDGTLELVNLNPAIKRVIDTVFKASVFNILPSLDKYFHAAAS